VAQEVEMTVNSILNALREELTKSERFENRGFGSFGRNPKSGKAGKVLAKYARHFKSGKELRVRVNGN
jgi:integration host factor subunit beta